MADIAKQFTKGRTKPEPSDDPPAKLAVYMDPALHRLAKSHAALEGVALSNLMVVLVQQHLDASEKVQEKALDTARKMTEAKRQRQR